MGEARQVMDRLADALQSHDADAIAACFAEDGEIVDPFGTTRGRQEIAEYWRKNFEAFPDLRLTVERTYESGDTAIDEWTFTGTQTGPIVTPEGQEIPATGRQVQMSGADFATVAGGLVTSNRAYFDQMAML